MAATGKRSRSRIATLALLILSLSSVSLAYRPGDIVPMSKMGQYHSVRFSISPFPFSWPVIGRFRQFDLGYLNRLLKIFQSRTTWHDMIGKHCPIFGVNREVSFVSSSLGISYDVG
ncbi:hypothetical protein LINPERHAP1_LOCUS12044 [Linum perenne]